MKDNPEELFPVVDENGNIMDAISRKEAHDGSKKLHPVVHLHVFNSKGELYLQRRPTWKDIQPGKWDTACGGHITLGENVEQALHREVREELGITDFTPHSLGNTFLKAQRKKNWYMYIVVHMTVLSRLAKTNWMEDAFGQKRKS